MSSAASSASHASETNMAKCQPLSSSDLPSSSLLDIADVHPSDIASECSSEPVAEEECYDMETLIEIFKTTDAFDHLPTPPGLRAYQVYPFSVLYAEYFGEYDDDDDEPELFYSWQSE
jgi:hypothetical protein